MGCDELYSMWYLLTWNLRTSRGLPADFKQFWLHFIKNFTKYLKWKKKCFAILLVLSKWPIKFVDCPGGTERHFVKVSWQWQLFTQKEWSIKVHSNLVILSSNVCWKFELYLFVSGLLIIIITFQQQYNQMEFHFDFHMTSFHNND